MGKFDEIQEIIKKLPASFTTEIVELKNALGRILQEDIFADADMPAFHKSAVDGYACHFEDINNPLEVQEMITAGMVPVKTVGKKQCSKIMTGAVVPDGCDCIFMVEDAENLGENHVKCINPATKRNILLRGEDYRLGEKLIQKGTIIQVSQMAVMAGVGKTKITVSGLPKIALIATGSELVEPTEIPAEGKIRNSNASQIMAQLQKMNFPVNYIGLAKDDFDGLTQLFQHVLKTHDFVIFTGGASVGDFDFIPEILNQQDFNIFWDRTGMKPGNPMTFSQKGEKYVFGLSGNPVSSLSQFELIAKPAIYQLLGANYSPFRIKAPLSFDYRQNQADRLILAPVIINAVGEIEAIPFNGSAHVNALVYANALMEVQVGQTEILTGDLAYVRPL
ncbi:MAG: molybdopterin molybdenumtransferase MoeA [Bacteroidetes bacterium]|nr:MAG: molybdopterin molybdenumtransferase MoeA [Bacteroidota bacterium]